MRKGGKIVVWPAYFDSDNSRRAGRRVPRNLASRAVKAEEIFQAALELGLNPDIHVGASHPRRSSGREGAVFVDKRGSKSQILMDLARKVDERRRFK